MITPDELVFAGTYALLCKDFIDYKRSLGYNYDIRQCYCVKYLCDYLEKHTTVKTGLSKELVEGYIRHRGEESPNTQIKRIYIIRQFGVYLTTLGYKSYLPPFDVLKIDKSFVPYIYTKDEISAILCESEKLRKVHQAPNSYLVYPVLLRILFGCGLRISEALRLKVSDVDMENGILHVNQSKFNNSRLIPLSPGLWSKCRKYYEQVGHFSCNERYFFEVSPGIPYQRGSIYNRFRYFLNQSGIEHNGRSCGPRLHDARHTYAVYALDHMVKQGMDIYCALPILSTYMGHRNIESTEKYVRLVPSFHEDIIKSMTETYRGVFPEVNHETE